jgi:3-hydroxyacyl-CoA dehydrogenase
VKPHPIHTVAVLGAGVMGAQIAAHLANAGLRVELLDLAGPDHDRNSVTRTALDRLRKLEPAPLADALAMTLIRGGNFDDHLERLSNCQLIIEAVAERMDIKKSLYARIAPHIGDDTRIASNTSGLSINALAREIPAALRSRFCGMHFFNPPRYMSLVELIPADDTRGELIDELESWLTSRLGKSVIRAKDTPNFIANRIGVFSLLAVMHHTEAFKLGLDTVDSLTGPRIGRPKSATYRTVDVVGIDTLAHVVKTMETQLPGDPWHSHFRLPVWIEGLIAQGALGQKSGKGLYVKKGKEIHVLDWSGTGYRVSDGAIAPEMDAILNIRNPAEKFTALRASGHPQAAFLWSVFRDVFHYSAFHLADIADNARDLDLALRWGFGWTLGPLETWQSAGWQTITSAIAEDIAAGRSMSPAPLPSWCTENTRHAVHFPQGSLAPGRVEAAPRSSLAVYARQIFPERLLGEAPAQSMGKEADTEGETLFENSGVRLWRLPQRDQGIGILSLRSPMHAVGDDVLQGMLASIRYAEQHLDGLVVWHEAPFSVGANLKQVTQAIQAGAFDRLDIMVAAFQETSQALKHCRVPVVAAASGMALGGGCEFLMHAQHRVMALETYAGLVEAGVGLIPAGGGCKEFAVRAAQWAASGPSPTEVFPYIQNVFTTIAMARVAKSAPQVIRMGFGKPSDNIIFHPRELLDVGIRSARQMAHAGWTPAPQGPIPVAGRTGIANLNMMLVNMREGEMISDHDLRVARAAATALCGGDVDAGTMVDEAWLIQLERRLFVDLLKTPETQARIAHMLTTGKALRN